MISEDEVVSAVDEVLGGLVSRDFPYASLSSRLAQTESDTGQELSAYGFVKWALDHYGNGAVYTNVLSSQAAVDGYAAEASRQRDSMPELLLSAVRYVKSILENIPDMDVCLAQLEGMSFPHVLYVLFAGSGQADVVDRYRGDAAEALRRCPSLLDKLPADLRARTMEALNADPK